MQFLPTHTGNQGLQRGTLTLLVALISTVSLLVSTDRPASAAAMEHHDLASLWHLAAHVVEAEEVSAQHHIEAWNKTRTWRITKAYKGSLKVGEQVEVFDSSYSMSLALWGASNKAQTTRSPRAWLFLNPARQWEVKPGVLTSKGLFELVPSGLRVVFGKRVHRFAQGSNPGPYAPTPQGPEPEEIVGLRHITEQEALDARAFEAALVRAGKHADACTKAMAIKDRARRDAAILALLPAARTWPAPVPLRGMGFFADDLGRRMQQRVVEGGDLEAILEAYGRRVDGGWRTYSPQNLFSPDVTKRATDLLSAAEESARPLHQRDAALRLLANAHSLDRKALSGVLGRLAVLLGDKASALRMAAVDAIGALCPRLLQGAALKHLVAGFDAEQDPQVLLQYGHALRSLNAAHALPARLKGPRALILSASAGPALGKGRVSVVLHHMTRNLLMPPQLELEVFFQTPQGPKKAVKTSFLSSTAGQGWGYRMLEVDVPSGVLPGSVGVSIEVKAVIAKGQPPQSRQVGPVKVQVH